MLELLTATHNLPFAVALCMMLIIAVVEGVAMLVGVGLSDVLDAMLPEVDLELDFDADASPSAFSQFLGWLKVGRVPALMLLVVFLTAFGLMGLIVQASVHGVLGTYAPASIAALVVFFLSLPVVSIVGGALAQIMPSDETDAVYSSSFVGRTASITLGTARPGSPAQAKLADEHGHTHYVMVEPADAGASFLQGSDVELIEQNGAVFKAVVVNAAGLEFETHEEETK